MRHARDGRACLPRRSRWRNSDGLSGTASQRERRMGVGSSICAYVVGRDGRRVPVTIILWGSSALFHAPRPRVCDLASRVRGNTPMVTHLRPSVWPRRRGPPSLSVDRSYLEVIPTARVRHRSRRVTANARVAAPPPRGTGPGFCAVWFAARLARRARDETARYPAGRRGPAPCPAGGAAPPDRPARGPRATTAASRTPAAPPRAFAHAAGRRARL
jgi:hypothetical protein